MNRKIGRSRCVGLALTGCACVGIVLAGVWLGGGGEGTVYDRNGKEIGALYLDGGILQYRCEEGYEAYMDLVRSETLDLVMEQEEADEKKAARQIVSAAMEIYTPLDPEAMEAVRSSYESNMDPSVYHSASVVCDTEGALTACYSLSRDTETYNYVTVPHYPGSAVKPLSVYGPALEEGVITWSSMYKDSPYAMVENQKGEMEEWPVNTEPYSEQMLPVCEAVKTSNNAIAVKVLKDYGAQRACFFLHNMFDIETESELDAIRDKGEDRVLGNIALGYLEEGVTVRKMAEAYQVFSNMGVYTPSYTVTEIREDGDTYYQREAEGKRVFRPGTAYIVNRLLREAVLNGTGTGAQAEGTEVCGKTGTSEYGDHWFAGVTPGYSCAVWYEEQGIQGTTDRSAMIFRDIMKEISTDAKEVYPIPSEVTEALYCKKSGKLAGGGCRQTGKGFFDIQNLPERCSQCG